MGVEFDWDLSYPADTSIPVLGQHQRNQRLRLKSLQAEQGPLTHRFGSPRFRASALSNIGTVHLVLGVVYRWLSYSKSGIR